MVQRGGESRALAEAREFRAGVMQGDAQMLRTLQQAYRPVMRRLTQQIDDLTRLIAERARAGAVTTPGSIVRLAEYREMAAGLERALDAYGVRTTGVITSRQRSLIVDAIEHSRTLAGSQLPRGVNFDTLTSLGYAWAAVDADALEVLVGAMRDGSTLNTYLRTQLVRGTMGRLTSTLEAGMLENPRVTAAHMKTQLAGGMVQALRVARTECLLPDALVDGAVVEAVYRRWYDGPVIEIVTSDGREFTATPNHPMLTQRGWVGAGEITQTDYLVSHAGEQDTSASRNEHVHRRPATISEVFDAAAAIGIIERERGGHPDFHGDGREGDVDIARPDRPLLFGRFAALTQPLVQRFLTPSDAARAPFCDRCGGLLGINQRACRCGGAQADASGQHATTDNSRGDAEVSGDGGGRNASQILPYDLASVDVMAIAGLPAGMGERGRASGIGAVPSQPSGFDRSPDVLGVGAHDRHDLPHTQARAVQLDRVISIRVRSFAGHVFNLSTPYGYFTYRGAYTGNTLRAYREAERAQYEANDDLVRGYRRIATLDDRTCAACYLMDGVLYPNDRDLDEHVQGRCFTVPELVPLSALGIRGVQAEPLVRAEDTGRARFLRADESEQRRIVGNDRLYGLWADGRIPLNGLVGWTRDPVWGDSLGVNSAVRALDGFFAPRIPAHDTYWQPRA